MFRREVPVQVSVIIADAFGDRDRARLEERGIDVIVAGETYDQPGIAPPSRTLPDPVPGVLVHETLAAVLREGGPRVPPSMSTGEAVLPPWEPAGLHKGSRSEMRMTLGAFCCVELLLAPLHLLRYRHTRARERLNTDGLEARGTRMPATSLKRKAEMPVERLERCHDGSGIVDGIGAVDGGSPGGERRRFVHDDAQPPGASPAVHRRTSDKERYGIVSGRGIRVDAASAAGGTK